MANRRTATFGPRLLAALFAAGVLAGCADQDSRTMASGTERGVETQREYLTGYPFRPAPTYRIEELDELAGPEGYTGAY